MFIMQLSHKPKKFQISLETYERLLKDRTFHYYGHKNSDNYYVYAESFNPLTQEFGYGTEAYPYQQEVPNDCQHLQQSGGGCVMLVTCCHCGEITDIDQDGGYY